VNYEPTLTPEQWNRINELFHATAQLPPSQRDAYLIEVCPDEFIRREVGALLANATGDDFLKLGPRYLGKILGHYRVVDYIGQGSMGQVYQAHDTRLDRFVALKFLPPELKSDARGARRLLREAKNASALNHPNIVVIHGIEHDEILDVDFIVMEYITGKTLAAAIRDGPIPIGRTLGYARQMADALAAAHAQGILHGDLKPTNIMITGQDLVKLLDFGLARLRERELAGDTAKSEFFGTTAYMAPERIGLPLIDPRSEIFSFGVILYEMLSGIHPFRAGGRDREEVAAAIHHDLPPPLPSEIPERLAAVVGGCLEKQVSQRFQSMQDVVSALERQGWPESSISSPPPRQDASVERVRLMAAGITYDNVARSLSALRELTDLFDQRLSLNGREAAISTLRDVILTLEPYPDGVPGTVRRVRRAVMEALKHFASGNLGPLFAQGELEELDLFGMNLNGCYCQTTSFLRCFLAESTFRGCRLVDSSFAGAFIRNVDFTDADITGVDFTDADWFNTVGLTEPQLAAAKRHTLRACPRDITALHRYLDDHYAYRFSSWPSAVQDQLKEAWGEYLKPGGLRELVAAWHRLSH
jgi:serine/threonine protein kinase